jgi:protein gp37
MVLAEHHTFQVLTKRPQRAARLLTSPGFRDDVTAKVRAAGLALGGTAVTEIAWPAPNIWVGTSIEANQWVWRADHLRDTPAAVRFLSLEPLLGALPSLDLGRIGWVITGGESGPGARPTHPDWVRGIRDRCTSAAIPFFFKQWGAWRPVAPLAEWLHTGAAGGRNTGIVHLSGENRRGKAFGSLSNQLEVFAGDPSGADWVMERGPKNKAGRQLDGRTWDQMPMPARGAVS